MRFQVGVDKQTGREIAMKVVSVRQRVRARVESVKGQVSVFFSLLKSISPWGRGIFFVCPTLAIHRFVGGKSSVQTMYALD